VSVSLIAPPKVESTTLKEEEPEVVPRWLSAQSDQLSRRFAPFDYWQLVRPPPCSRRPD
jgi:hypothetical protein